MLRGGGTSGKGERMTSAQRGIFMVRFCGAASGIARRVWHR